jgi:hypothetical protein
MVRARSRGNAQDDRVPCLWGRIMSSGNATGQEEKTRRWNYDQQENVQLASADAGCLVACGRKTVWYVIVGRGWGSHAFENNLRSKAASA